LRLGKRDKDWYDRDFIKAEKVSVKKGGEKSLQNGAGPEISQPGWKNQSRLRGPRS